jgi:hypothetical protein
MVMIGDITILFQNIATFVRCSRRSRSPGDLANAESSAEVVGSKPTVTPAFQDLCGLSTDGSNNSTNGSSPDVSDDESTTESLQLDSCSDSKPDPLDKRSQINEDVTGSSQNMKESCLNKWAQPFLPAAPSADKRYAPRCASSDLRSEADIHANLAHVISRLSPADAATVSAFLQVKLAKDSMNNQPLRVQPDPVVEHDYYPLGGFKPPPGLCAGPPQMDCLREPLPPGLVRRKAKNDHDGASKMQVTPEVQNNNLRSNLNKLSQFDPACIFLVRKINRLGLNSADFLKEYFSKFGMVDSVMVSHSIEKPTPGRRKPRVRPAGLAFIVMSKAEDVASILRLGSEHVVNDVSISASTYEHTQQAEEMESGPFEE